MIYKDIENKNIKALNKALINILDEICTKHQITLSEWAINSGVTPSTLYEFKNGKTRVLNIITIKKLCDSLKLTLSNFFDNSEINLINFDE